MRRIGSRDVFSASVTQGQCVNARKEVLAGTEENWGDGDVHLVNKSGLEVLANRANAAAEPDILTIGCVGRPLQCGTDSVCDEVESGAALHGD